MLQICLTEKRLKYILLVSIKNLLLLFLLLFLYNKLYSLQIHVEKQVKERL